MPLPGRRSWNSGCNFRKSKNSGQKCTGIFGTLSEHLLSSTTMTFLICERLNWFHLGAMVVFVSFASERLLIIALQIPPTSTSLGPPSQNFLPTKPLVLWFHRRIWVFSPESERKHTNINFIILQCFFELNGSPKLANKEGESCAFSLHFCNMKIWSE